MKYILSAFADEYEDDFDGQLEGLSRNCIKNIELRFVDGVNVSELSEKRVKEVKRELELSGITVSSIGSPVGKSSVTGDFAIELARAERTFRNAVGLGADKVRIFSFFVPDRNNKTRVRDEVLRRLEGLIKLADNYSLTLCHENEAKIYGESDDDCLELLQAFGGRLRAVFDAGNFTLDGVDALKAYEKLKVYVEYFHIKDALAAGAIVPPGKGEAKLKTILSRFKASADRDVVVTLEPHLQTFGGFNALTDKSFDNPYKFESRKEAFCVAADALKAIIKEIE